MRYKHFTKDERNELYVLLKKGYSIREIASVLKRSPSSVSREIKRNTTKNEYCPRRATNNAYHRRYRAKRQCMKIRDNPDKISEILNNLAQYPENNKTS